MITPQVGIAAVTGFMTAGVLFTIYHSSMVPGDHLVSTSLSVSTTPSAMDHALDHALKHANETAALKKQLQVARAEAAGAIQNLETVMQASAKVEASTNASVGGEVVPLDENPKTDSHRVEKVILKENTELKHQLEVARAEAAEAKKQLEAGGNGNENTQLKQQVETARAEAAEAKKQLEEATAKAHAEESPDPNGCNIAHSEQGTCNRLKSIASAIYNNAAATSVQWNLDAMSPNGMNFFEKKGQKGSHKDDSGLQLSDLFTWPPATDAAALARLEKGECSGWSDWRLILNEEDHKLFPPYWKPSLIMEYGTGVGYIDFEFNNIPAAIRYKYAAAFAKIQFSPAIITEVTSQLSTWPAPQTNMATVHMRTFGKELTPEFLGCFVRGAYIFSQSAACKSEEGCGFFLAGDNEDEITKFGNKIITGVLNKKWTHYVPSDHMAKYQAIMVDLLLLGKGSTLMGTSGSTFNEVAWWLGGADQDVNMCTSEAQQEGTGLKPTTPYNGALRLHSGFNDEISIPPDLLQKAVAAMKG